MEWNILMAVVPSNLEKIKFPKNSIVNILIENIVIDSKLIRTLYVLPLQIISKFLKLLIVTKCE